jgi:hypothetical protein
MIAVWQKLQTDDITAINGMIGSVKDTNNHTMGRI